MYRGTLLDKAGAYAIIQSVTVNGAVRVRRVGDMAIERVMDGHSIGHSRD